VSRTCICPYHRLRLHGWKAKEIAGHAPCCPLFDSKQYTHPLEEDIATFHGPVFSSSVAGGGISATSLAGVKSLIHHKLAQQLSKLRREINKIADDPDTDHFREIDMMHKVLDEMEAKLAVAPKR
jgi:hypothetical protein